MIIVIIVIAILATLGVISYSTLRQNAAEKALAVDLQSTAAALTKYKSTNGTYPSSANFSTAVTSANTSGGTTYTYTYNSSDNSYCLQATNQGSTYYIVNTSSGAQKGTCTPSSLIADGTAIQTITAANCPTTRTRAVDARDNHTYWVQKLADNKCWMLTNLSYAGSGTNTYGDTKTLTNGTSSATTFTTASYYVPTSGTNITIEPTAPSTSTDGTGQYGYLYNWCAAMGAQATAACLNASTPTPDTNISICPSGWRLPTGGTTGELKALNDAVNSGSTTSDAGLRTTWLGQKAGYWVGYSVFTALGTAAGYWSSTLYTSTNGYGYALNFDNANVFPSNDNMKNYGYAVRCVAS